ncbi:ABC transporter A family member 7 [Artemisia annua]|uniref:ABC transporter A family member 7 n=1 Tax=Artemisia annua TaxID=35608 RepID=A0A2U1NIF8_ARTAN|nr:ABC transporter A family member 7 [Artemisia annua]
MMKMHGLGDGPYWMISYAYFIVKSLVYMFCFVVFGSVVGVWIIVMELYQGFSLYGGLFKFSQYAFMGNYMGTHGIRWENISDNNNGIGQLLIIMVVEWLRERVERSLLEHDTRHAIVCDNVRKVYPGRDGNPEKFVVRGLSLALSKGECFGMLGPNGAGKSSFIHMMTGLIKPSSGTAYVRGLDIRDDMEEIYANMGAVEESLRSVNLLNDGVGDNQAGKYSGGMKRRLSVAISLIEDPTVCSSPKGLSAHLMDKAQSSSVEPIVTVGVQV